MSPRPPVQPHQHGTITGYTYGCRCPSCAKANAARSKVHRRRRIHGTISPHDRTNPAAARDVIARMRKAGYRDPQIGRLAGLPNATIGRIRNNRGRYITRETSDRILQAERLCPRMPPRDAFHDLYVQPTAARRRIRALMTRGYRIRDLEQELGGSGGGLSPLLYTDVTITHDRDRRIAEMYERLWRTTGPSAAAARQALAKGWATPLELDDDRIDDPSYVPALHRLTPEIDRRQRREQTLLTVATLTDRGVSAKQIARHIGASSRNVQRLRGKLRAAS